MGSNQLRAVVTFATIFIATQSLHAVTHYYHHRLTGECGLFIFRDALTNSPAKGHHYEVEEDDAGRMLRASAVENGKRISELVYHYNGDRKLPDSLDIIANGERTGIVKLRFDDSGCLERSESFTTHGVRTSYVTRTHRPGIVELQLHTTDGSEKSRETNYFNDQGILIRVKRPPTRDSIFEVETECDPQTGLATTQRQFHNGRLTTVVKCQFDEDGALTRREACDAKGHCYGIDEFKGILLVRRTVSASDTDKVEYNYHHDLHNRIDETLVLHNGVHLCTLTYQRLSNGKVVRTTAKSPDGEIWADYPDQEVISIDRNGQRAGGTNAIIYRKSRWW